MADVFNNNPGEYVDLNNLFPVLNERVGLTWQQFQALVENVNYVKNNASGGDVSSVNGQTGDVLLTNTDVNAVGSNLQPTQDSRVSSILNHTKNGISYNKSIYREGGILVKSSNMRIDGSDIVLTETEGIETKEKRPTINGEEIAYLSDFEGSGGFDLSKFPKFINKLYINVSKAGSAESYLIEFQISNSSNFAVDWGDGSPIETFVDATTEISHQYLSTFKGWVMFYGSWKGIQFRRTQISSGKQVIIKADYDSNITSVVGYGFYNCENMTHFYHKAVSSLDVGAFYGTKINSLDTSKITSVSQDCMPTNLKGTLELPLISSISANALAGLNSLERIYIPNSQSLANIRGTNIVEIKTGKSLTQIIFSTLNVPKVKTLEIISDNDVTASSAPDSNEYIENYFVPKEKLKYYKTATNWITVADKIYPHGGQYSEVITLPVANWADNAQTVEVVGATSEMRNDINIYLVDGNGKKIKDTYGLTFTQGTMQLTFECETLPTEDIQVFVVANLTNY